MLGATVEAGAWSIDALGWVVRSEVSFNRYGDRGRIDLFAHHPVRRVILVVEIKTVLVDAQALLGGLDKARVARHVAMELGWQARVIVPAIVLVEGCDGAAACASARGALLAVLAAWPCGERLAAQSRWRPDRRTLLHEVVIQRRERR